MTLLLCSNNRKFLLFQGEQLFNAANLLSWTLNNQGYIHSCSFIILASLKDNRVCAWCSHCAAVKSKCHVSQSTADWPVTHWQLCGYRSLIHVSIIQGEEHAWNTHIDCYSFIKRDNLIFKGYRYCFCRKISHCSFQLAWVHILEFVHSTKLTDLSPCLKYGSCDIRRLWLWY